MHKQGELYAPGGGQFWKGAAGTVGHAGMPAIFVGAFAFYLSDLAVARQRFVAKSFWNKAWGLPLYFGAQLILAWTTGA